MKRLRNAAALLLLLAFLAGIQGCVALGHKPADPDLPFVAAPTPPAGYMNLYLVRTYAQPTARRMDVFIDEQKIATLGNFSYTWVVLKPGTHKIRAQWSWDTAKPKLEFDIKAAEGLNRFVGFGGGYTMGTDTYTARSSSFEIPSDRASEALRGHTSVVPLVSQID